MPRPAAGAVVQGTCGWSDSDAPWSRPGPGATSADRLRMYANAMGVFGCVEVDTATYQLVPPEHVARWVAATPRGFKFCFKAFGFLCAKGGQLGGQFPKDLAEKVGRGTAGWVRLEEVPKDIVGEIWRRFHASLEPALAADKLGPTLFQYHVSFTPGEGNKQHVEWCRANLRADVQMAVEFRDRAWVSGAQLETTVKWLRGLGIALVVSDDLEHELPCRGNTVGPAHVQKVIKPRAEATRLPLVARVTTPAFAFARVHRRSGTERALTEAEIAEWSALLRGMRSGGGLGEPSPQPGLWDEARELDPPLQGPVFMLWGTDCKDQQLLNARALQRALGPQAYDWAAHLREVGAQQKGGMQAFLARGKRQREEAAAAAAGAEGSDEPPPAHRQEPRPQRQRQEPPTQAPAQTQLRASPPAATQVEQDGSQGQRDKRHEHERAPAAASSASSQPAAAPAASAGPSPPFPVVSPPPAREAAFLAAAERGDTNAEAIDPAVFRALPPEIRAELVSRWWEARPDVVAAKKRFSAPEQQRSASASAASGGAGKRRRGKGGERSVLEFFR